jgi:hypothetical protein
LEFRRNGNHNLAGTTAKIPFPRNSRNLPDSAGFRQEYMGDCKELTIPFIFYSSMLFDDAACNLHAVLSIYFYFYFFHVV